MTTSIQARVLALVGAGVFVASGIVSLVSRSSLLALEDQVGREHARVAAALAAGVSAAVEHDLRLLTTTTAAPRLDLEDGDDLPERAALTAVVGHGQTWCALAFLDADGRVVVSEPESSRGAWSDGSGVAAAIRAIQRQRIHVGELVAPEPGGAHVLLVVPFRQPDGRSGGAAALVNAGSPGLADLVQLSEPGPTQRIELRDGAGAVLVARSGRDAVDSGTLASVARVGGTPWTIRLADTGADAAWPVLAFRRRSIWLAPLLSVVAMLFGWGIARSVRRPLSRLTDSAERIAHGDLQHGVDQGGAAAAGDEVSRLAGALERMRASLQFYVSDIERANRELERRVEERTSEVAAANTRLEERERVRQQLLRKVISAQEDERRRIARELHDETSQTLAALSMSVETALATSQAADTRERLSDVRRLVDRMQEELHRLIVNLRPSILDDLGLAAAIRWFAGRQLGSAGVAVRCEVADLERRLPSEIETALFRAVQEAVVNIARHAGAESVLIQGTLDAGRLAIEVEDDGRGFDVAGVPERSESLRGIGLLGMRERLEILGGQLTIDSEPGAGTRVIMEVPMTL